MNKIPCAMGSGVPVQDIEFLYISRHSLNKIPCAMGCGVPVQDIELLYISRHSLNKIPCAMGSGVLVQGVANSCFYSIKLSLLDYQACRSVDN